MPPGGPFSPGGPKMCIRDSFVTASQAPDRREQRKLDQAAGLVPFPVKLSQAQADQLRAAAAERGVSTNDIVAEALQKALG